MFYLSNTEELTTELLQKMINRFRVNVQPKLEKYKNYYDGKQAILQKSYADKSKPNNKTVINYCKSIVDNFVGYVATPSHIGYKSDDDIEDIMAIMRYNDYQTEDSDLLLDALVYGIAYELMYTDAEAQTRFRLINPTTCFGVCDDSLTGDLRYFVRMYEVSDWDDTDLYQVDVYSDSTIKHYEMQGQNGWLKFISEEPHYFSQCPANILTLPDEKSIFDCIMSLQDTMNELLSAEIDDFASFCDAYLLITGADMDSEEVAKMKENRVLVLPEGASANWLIKGVNDAQIENMLKRMHDSIYRISACVDFSSEALMSGIASGLSIHYKMSGMENRAGKIEAQMRKALQRRIEIICGIASLKLGEDVFRDIEITFKRNIPEDITSTINVINALKGTVSDATLLSQIPFIVDVNAEIEAVEEQKANNMAMYGFGFTETDEEEESEF